MEPLLFPEPQGPDSSPKHSLAPAACAGTRIPKAKANSPPHARARPVPDTVPDVALVAGERELRDREIGSPLDEFPRGHEWIVPAPVGTARSRAISCCMAASRIARRGSWTPPTCASSRRPKWSVSSRVPGSRGWASLNPWCAVSPPRPSFDVASRGSGGASRGWCVRSPIRNPVFGRSGRPSGRRSGSRHRDRSRPECSPG